MRRLLAVLVLSISLGAKAGGYAIVVQRVLPVVEQAIAKVKEGS